MNLEDELSKAGALEGSESSWGSVSALQPKQEGSSSCGMPRDEGIVALRRQHLKHKVATEFCHIIQ